MKISVIYMGKTRDDYIKTGLDDYTTRIKRFISLDTIEIPEIKSKKALSVSEIKKIETEKLQTVLHNRSFVVLLDANGKQYSSTEFATFLQKKMISSTKELTFVTGGAYGFDSGIMKYAHAVISLSPMTFSHQMVRLILAEQIYRALSIIYKRPYHH